MQRYSAIKKYCITRKQSKMIHNKPFCYGDWITSLERDRVWLSVWLSVFDSAFDSNRYLGTKEYFQYCSSISSSSSKKYYRQESRVSRNQIGYTDELQIRWCAMEYLYSYKSQLHLYGWDRQITDLIEFTIPFSSSKGLMTIGYDVCHDPADKRRSFSAMVGSVNDQCHRWYSTITNHRAGEEVSINFAFNVESEWL